MGLCWCCGFKEINVVTNDEWVAWWERGKETKDVRFVFNNTESRTKKSIRFTHVSTECPLNVYNPILVENGGRAVVNTKTGVEVDP